MEPAQTNQSNPNEFTVLGQGTIKEVNVQGPYDKFKKIGLFLIILILSFYSFSFLLSKFNRKPSSVNTPSKPLTKLKETETPLALQTYIDSKNLFSIQHSINVTEGRSADDPFPVALQLRYLDPVNEFKIGEEKPGWFLRISQRLDNSKEKSPIDFAKENKLVVGEEVSSLTLAGRPAIKWRSAVYPQTFYLLDSGDGFFFIKTQINSQFVEKHQVTIDAVLGTLKFLEKPVDPDLGFKWVRQSFSDFWNIEYPQDWGVTSGFTAGALEIVGKYNGDNFQIDFSYPHFEGFSRPIKSLGDWFSYDLTDLTDDQKNRLIVKNLKISGTESKEVLNFPLGSLSADYLYIWSRSGRNPSFVYIKQTSGELDAEKMAVLFERFVKGVK